MKQSPGPSKLKQPQKRTPKRGNPHPCSDMKGTWRLFNLLGSASEFGKPTDLEGKQPNLRVQVPRPILGENSLKPHTLAKFPPILAKKATAAFAVSGLPSPVDFAQDCTLRMRRRETCNRLVLHRLVLQLQQKYLCGSDVGSPNVPKSVAVSVRMEPTQKNG